MEYLFSVAIGPAQEFITTARRTRDLWFSSYLLSELSKAAAKEIGKDKLIFPVVASNDDLNPDSEFNVVNKILARIEDDPQELGEQVKNAVRARLNEIKEKAFRGIDDAYDAIKAKAQIDDLPEIYWAAVPLLDGQYKQARAEVEALLAARKNTRDFQSAKWAGNEAKSSLDGLRESVMRNATALENKGVKKTEVLCGVGLLKRFGKPTSQREDEGFASVPHIAAWPLIDSFNETNQKDLNEYVCFLREKKISSTALYRPVHPRSGIFPYDGHLLYEEQLKEYFNEDTQKAELKQAKEKLRDLLKDEIGKTPSPYYAILHGDGDFMGKAIDAQETADDHKNLSAALSQFAGRVKQIVHDHQGSLIYAGGDDVLALVPLHKVVGCALQLANEFKSKLSEFKSENNPPPTLSVGIGISHQMEPLDDALNLARAAEKEAKQLEGKNALCLKVSKRSGSVTTVKGKWGELDDHLNLFVGLHERDEVPDGAAYELRRLADDFKHFTDHRAEAYQKEAARILSRKRAKRSTEEIKKDVQEKLLSRLSADGTKPEEAMRSVADELIVAKLFVNPFKPKGETK
jgi:CRISPR-associated protein Cmr2